MRCQTHTSGIVPDAEICGHPRTLGAYIHLHGGTQNRSKKTWGVLVPIDDEETIYDKEYTSTTDSV